MAVLQYLGQALTRFLAAPRDNVPQNATTDMAKLAACIQPGDVLLVEGSSRFSSAIKYLSQSNWSHSALYTGDIFERETDGERHVLIEADIVEGVRSIPLSNFANKGTRICRPVGLTRAEIDAVIAHTVSRINHRYDLKNIIDLARYLIQTPPVPVQWRRRMLALGSGDPTRAICSSLIAEAFQSVRYPILPMIAYTEGRGRFQRERQEEILHIRHHSLYTPADFDVSPYFRIIKPTIELGFDPHKLVWAEGTPDGPAPARRWLPWRRS